MTFENRESFDKWVKAQVQKRRLRLKSSLTPFQFYITQLKGSERPFTGAYWDTRDVGMYSCIVCTQRLFMFDHKYINKSGYPTFWSSIKDAVKLRDDLLK